MDLGIAATICAKLDPERVLNYMAVDELLDWAEAVRDRAC
jgi:hypothetical protein